ncbi:MAG: ATP-binding protein [Acidimicrobiales bacterium]|jgi:propionyl-CoA carboxylase alpha chain
MSEPRSITRLLVANRGEIARRIMRSCASVGIETVAVFSDADASADFVQDADLAVSIGGNTPAESYLRIDAILAAAAKVGADAIHPGYGFLAENAGFAQAVSDAGLIFIGPSPEVISVMGSKLESKKRMSEAGVPLLPSADLTGLDDAAVVAAAVEVGYPVLIKASAGGGGRGMRIVLTPDLLLDSVASAAREAVSAFGDGTIYAERYVSPSRHVEVQIFGDEHGRVVHFHERECSIQRRHQKIIEEAPSASITDATRAALHQAAVTAGEAIGYTNAGTVEFLLAPGIDGAPEEFFFLEVNTRLQVEHPVTEAILDVDLVALQLQVAVGGAVPAQSAIGPVQGHAMEARLYAEDPTADFQPSTGIVSRFDVPGRVRLDTAIDRTGEVTQFYDPMIAKVITHAGTRTAAALELASALAATTIDGISTNRDLLVRTLRHPEFLGDQGDSDFLIRHDPAVLGRPLVEGPELALHAAAAALALQTTNRETDGDTPSVSSGFRNVFTAPQRIELAFGDQILAVGHRFVRGTLSALEVDGVALVDAKVFAVTPDSVDLSVDGVRRQFAIATEGALVSATTSRGSVTMRRIPRFVEPEDQVEAGSTVASMPGTIVAVNVAIGDEVSTGDVLLVMEAMKMELSITASFAGTVAAVAVNPGDSVEAGMVLAIIEEAEISAS